MTGPYWVSTIYEDDYGCEERSPDQEPQVLVVLRNTNGRETVIRQPDAWLYANAIYEGDRVHLFDHRLHKAE